MPNAMGGPRQKPVTKDKYGVIHIKRPNSSSEYPWCVLYVPKSGPGHLVAYRYKMCRWVEPDEVVNCIRCILISYLPDEAHAREFFLY